jgi:hypothetical protein
MGLSKGAAGWDTQVTTVTKLIILLISLAAMRACSAEGEATIRILVSFAVHKIPELSPAAVCSLRKEY